MKLITLCQNQCNYCTNDVQLHVDDITFEGFVLNMKLTCESCKSTSIWRASELYPDSSAHLNRDFVKSIVTSGSEVESSIQFLRSFNVENTTEL